MITHLHIDNYALIDSIDIDFTSGLNIITGETGAGKSIILGALSLLLGERAEMKTIRDTSRKTIIEAEFIAKEYPGITAILQANDIDETDDTVLLRRELSPSGRSRAFVNDTPVNLPVMREISETLVDIHSQHQNLLLARRQYQLSIIDRLAGNEEILEKYAAEYRIYRHTLKQYTETRDMIARNQADADFISYQLQQLEELDLKPGEQKSLEEERDLLSNLTETKTYVTQTLDFLNNGSQSAVDSLNSAIDALENLSEFMPEAEGLIKRLESSKLEILDIADTVSQYDSRLGADPVYLSEIEERLARIYSQETKHHVDDSDSLIELRDSFRSKLSILENAEDTLKELHDKAVIAKKNATLTARLLSERRKAAAENLKGELLGKAVPLGLKNLKFEIEFTPCKLSPYGIDEVEFLFAFNKNQKPMTVGDTASGGEISRIILALKAVVAKSMQLPTIIFDEVDTGVSGDVALRMAELMVDVSSTSQVIAITHLAQVAAKGEKHFKVFKNDTETETITCIKTLDIEDRVGELALMISGSADDPAARETARNLIS